MITIDVSAATEAAARAAFASAFPDPDAWDKATDDERDGWRATVWPVVQAAIPVVVGETVEAVAQHLERDDFLATISYASSDYAGTVNHYAADATRRLGGDS